MRITCLAAGLCTRLRPHTENIHKLMLPLENELLVDVQIHSFSNGGASRISYVVGHGADGLENHIRKHRYPIEIELIKNDHFATRNLDWSAYLALSCHDGEVLYWEGDIIAAPELVSMLLNCDADMCLAYDPQPRSEKPDTQVIMENGRVSSLLFDEHPSARREMAVGAAGEFVCALKLSDVARRFVVSELERCFFTGQMQLYRIFDEAFTKFHCTALSTAGLPWIEIDTWSDFLRAKTVASDILGHLK